MRGCFEAALKEFHQSGEVEDFYEGIQVLLEQYYDPMYQYQLAKKQIEVIFEGPEQEYVEWAKSICDSPI